MITVQFPPPDFRVRKTNEGSYLFDVIRKKWIILTEEEWVRQNIIQYLIKGLQYPSTVIAVEKEIRLHDMKKRFDLLVYNADHQPWMLIECKAPHIPLTQDVLQQVLRYNMSVPVSYLIITNGKHTFGWQKQAGELIELNEMPAWVQGS